MPASFGLLPALAHKVKDKKIRYKAYQERSLEVLQKFKKLLEYQPAKDQFLVDIT